MSKRLALMLGWIVLIGVSMACALASSATDTPAPPPTGTATPKPLNTQPVVATFGPTIQVITNTVVITVAVTDTPTPTSPAPVADAATPTATSTPTATPTSTPTPTSTSTLGPTKTATKPKPTTEVPPPAGTTAPLSINYEVLSTKRNPGNQAVITLHVIAAGGGGGYKYYHDDVLQPNATFDVIGTCGSPLNHTLKVTSANGQSAALAYFVRPNCPTPTSTPKP